MKRNEIGNWLKKAMLAGGIVDSFMVIFFLIPALRILVFGENFQFHTPRYEWAMRVIASIGATWTITLFWASKKPFERKDILLLTVFPLMTGFFGFNLYGFLTQVISLQLFILTTIVTFVFCPFYIYIWAKARKMEKNN
jgi:hypothetical protein